MKTVPLARFIFFVTLISAGLVSAARWFHPATLSLSVVWLLLIIAFVSAAIIILSHD